MRADPINFEKIKSNSKSKWPNPIQMKTDFQLFKQQKFIENNVKFTEDNVKPCRVLANGWFIEKILFLASWCQSGDLMTFPHPGAY